MASTAETTTIEREIVIEATPEAVWALLTDPAKTRTWWGVTVDLDVRPGGAYRIEVIPGHVASGVFVEVDRPRRLTYTWGWEPAGETPNPVPPGSSTVEIELAPSATGTVLRFAHRDLPSTAATESHAVGWDHYLPRLQTAGSGTDPGRDPWLDRA